MIQTKIGDFSGAILPNEIILQILSYLVDDIDNLRKPWSGTCRLFRSVMEERIEKYCKESSVDYQVLKSEYYISLPNNKDNVLPFWDFIECSVARETIHKMGRYDFFRSSIVYPYIPSIICQVSALNESVLPTPNTMRIAMIVGNIPLCLSLLKDAGLRECARSIVKSILNGKGTRFWLRFHLEKYSAALPWDILYRALSRTFIACYENLKRESLFDDLPSRKEVIKTLLTGEKFVFVEECIKHWGIEIVVPFFADLLFKSPYSSQRIKTWNSLYKKLSKNFSNMQHEKIFQLLHESFSQKDQLYFSQYDANRLLFQLKDNFQPLKLAKFHEDVLFSKDAKIRLEHLFHKDAEYIPYLLKQDMAIDFGTLVKALESLDICTLGTKKVVLHHIQSLFLQCPEYLENPECKEILWNRAIRLKDLSMMKAMMERFFLDSIDIQQQVLAALADDEAEVLLNILELNYSPVLLETVKEYAVQYASTNIIYHFVKAGISNWDLDWHVIIQTTLEKEDYKTDSALQLLHYLLENKLINPSIELLNTICSYTERLLQFVHTQAQPREVVGVNLVDVIRLQWVILDALMRDHSQMTSMDLLAKMQESVKLVKTHIEPSKFNQLVPMAFCNAFRLKVLELIDGLFLKNDYSFLLVELNKNSNPAHDIQEILSLLGRKWWRTLVSRYSGDRIRYSLSVASKLIITYQIRDLEIFQNCFRAVKNSFQWDLLKPLIIWKITIDELTLQDEVMLQSCFDEKGYFLGPIGDTEVLGFINELCQLQKRDHATSIDYPTVPSSLSSSSFRASTANSIGNF